MILAGDVGGTKTLVGLFERGGGRPRPKTIRTYVTGRFRSFTEILDAFAADVPHPFTVDAAVAGVAGPVAGTRAHLTNIPWDMSADEITARFGTPLVRLLNDLEAMAMGVELLTGAELDVLQAGTPDRRGNAVVIAAGTGLGEACLHRIGGDAAPFHVMPSEAGHADFAARTDREIELVRALRDRYGRAEIEQVLSGPGLVNLHRLTHGGIPCTQVPDLRRPDAPAYISNAALGVSCARCVEALGLFVEAFGAEAGNLALRGKATAGVYIGGGIAPKILPALHDGRFMQAFLDKPPMDDLLAKMPVKVILNIEAGLLGAAVAAQGLLDAPAHPDT